MTERILITWERHEKYRLAMTPEDADGQFGTTDPAQIRALMLAEHRHIDDLEAAHAPDGEGTLSVTATGSVAWDAADGIWWRTDGETPIEDHGPFPSADAAFTYWQERG